MQKDLFGNEIKPKVVTPTPQVTTMNTDEDDKHTKEYCFDEIRKEQYLWDMRCWKKSRFEHTKQDVLDWIDGGCEPNNCGHVQYCIERLLDKKWASREEIADAVLSNKIVQYPHEIGTWEVDYDPSGDDEVIVEEIEL